MNHKNVSEKVHVVVNHLRIVINTSVSCHSPNQRSLRRPWKRRRIPRPQRPAVGWRLGTRSDL